MGCGPTGSSVHGILQARVPEWVAIPFFRGSSRAWVSPAAGGFFVLSEPPGKAPCVTFCKVHFVLHVASPERVWSSGLCPLRALVVPDGRKGVGSFPVPAPVRSAVCPRDFLPALPSDVPGRLVQRGPSGHKCLAGVSQGKRHREDTCCPVPGERVRLGLRSQSPPDPRAGHEGPAQAGSGRQRRGGHGYTEPCLQQEAPGGEPSLPGQGLED